MRIGVYVDTCNLYHCVRARFDGRKLDYSKYLKFLEPIGDIVITKAYGAQAQNEAKPFIIFLKKLGFETYWKGIKFYDQNRQNNNAKADWDVGIAMDIVRDVPNLDLVVLGTADSDLAPLVDWVQEQNTQVIILATKISRELQQSAHKCIEVTEDMVQ